MKKEENMIDSWLAEHSDPEIDQFIEKNLEITDKVFRILKERGIKKKAFAEMLGKKPSEITKWLTGMHNLTLKSIVKMEVALGVDLIHTEPVKEYEYVYLGSVEGGDMERHIADYNESDQETDFSIAL